MNTSVELKATPEQVLLALRGIWPDIVGDRTPFDAGTRIDHQMQRSDAWAELDLADIAIALDRYFEIPTDDRDGTRRRQWEEFFGAACMPDAQQWEREVGPRFTFGALAEFIAGRLPVERIEIVRVLGTPCVAAGAFFLLRRLVTAMTPAGASIWPSTPIRKCVRGYKLPRLWDRLRWLSNGAIPPLRMTMRSRFGEALSAPVGMCFMLGLPILGGLVLGHCMQCGWLLPTVVLGVLLWGSVVAVGTLWDYLEDPLPRGFRTYRDVAHVLAQQRVPSFHGDASA